MSSMPLASAFRKMAELPEPPPDSGEYPQDSAYPRPADIPTATIRHPALHALGALGTSALAFGTGMAAGYGGMVGLHRLLHKPIEPTLLQHAVPMLGGVAALAYQQLKGHEHKELVRALEAYKNKPTGPIPAGQR